ncbi:MAG: 4-alpha-glucanotransferase [Thermodesulfobacteriota bacterium]|nr:4-alpha-glucanotransferase [Thermodesulfobacteriota bacterium]
MKRRGSGVLLHVPSLHSRFGIGDLGPQAFRFVDFLVDAKQSFWQILPLNPIEPAYGSSPYHSISAFACSSLFISPELLLQDGLLNDEDIMSYPVFSYDRIDYAAVISSKRELFFMAYQNFKKRTEKYDYRKFCQENSVWLDDYSLFAALKSHYNGKTWSDWPPELRDRENEALESAATEFHDRIDFEKFLQYIFFTQWFSLKQYCGERGIQIIGDMPIYVQYDSVDLWTHPEVFKLNEAKKPYAVAGVPPDYFSKTGQLWGNPLYRWDVLKDTGYRWWVQRTKHALKLFDMVRIDHFRGLVGYWEIPAGEKTAMNGKWIEAPAEDFLMTLLRKFPYLPVIAEDLGVITPDVREIMSRFELPGMKILLFAFGDDLSTNPYIPHNLAKNCIVYPGTHDNNTVKGWFENEAAPEEKERLFQYLGREVSNEDISWEFIRMAMMSVANLAVTSMQDILNLGEEARMNRPATTQGNWQWRLLPGQLSIQLSKKLRQMTEIYGRA